MNDWPDAGVPPWVLGVFFGVAACIGIAFGMTCLKYTHMKIERLQENYEVDPANNEEPSPYYCHLSWIGGFSLIIIASGPLDMGALALLPQSVFAPLSGLTLCLNAVISPWLLGETLTNFDAAATCLVVIGAGLTTVFGSHKNENYTVDVLDELFSTSRVMIFECIVWIITAMCIVTVRATWFEEAYKNNPNSRVGPAAYGVIAGGAGAQQFLFLKASIELIKTAVEKGGVFLKFQTYVFFAGAIMCALIQIRFLNEGLASCDVVTFLPMYNTWLIMMGILNGAIVYNEFTENRMGAESNYVYFFLGCFLCLLGILVLMMGGPSKQTDFEEDNEESALLPPPTNERGSCMQSNCMQSAKEFIPISKDNLPTKISRPKEPKGDDAAGENQSAPLSARFEPAGEVERMQTPALQPVVPPKGSSPDQDHEVEESHVDMPDTSPNGSRTQGGYKKKKGKGRPRAN